jgi:hypothetical protein
MHARCCMCVCRLPLQFAVIVILYDDTVLSVILTDKHVALMASVYCITPQQLIMITASLCALLELH